MSKYILVIAALLAGCAQPQVVDHSAEIEAAVKELRLPYTSCIARATVALWDRPEDPGVLADGVLGTCETESSNLQSGITQPPMNLSPSDAVGVVNQLHDEERRWVISKILQHRSAP